MHISYKINILINFLVFDSIGSYVQAIWGTLLFLVKANWKPNIEQNCTWKFYLVPHFPSLNWHEIGLKWQLDIRPA